MFLAAALPGLATAAPGPQAPSGSAGANSSDGVGYLRAQGEAAAALIAAGDRDGAIRAIDRSLSLIATLTNPQVVPEAVATALSEAIAMLLQVGEAERAWGLYRASGDAIAAALPAGSVEAAAYRLTEAQLLQQVGDPAGSIRALDLAAPAFEGQSEAIGPILSLKAVVAASRGDLDTARRALAASPYAPAYATPGRVAASYEEIAYLAARAYVASLEGRPDPVVAGALQSTPRFPMDAATADLAATYRLAGLAMASPPGPTRADAVADLARRIGDGAARDLHYRWVRPGAVDQILIGMALSQPPADPDARAAAAAFTLFQLAGRTGRSFDADALAALAQARDEAQRRTVHQALRLKARRDRLVRVQVQAIAAGLGTAARGADRLRHDAASRLLIRDFDVRIAAAEALLSGSGVDLSGGRLTPLARLQAVLAPDEAALAMAPTPDGFAYMCVRRARLTLAAAPVDAARLRLDVRLVQASLTAGHAPSEQLDAQFPAEAAVRLYEVMIRPFERCLQPGDRIAWLSAPPPVPLSALLSSAPPRLGRGYDLAAADWLVRRHAVAYAGSAAMIVAARTAHAPPRADFDFLGVGDPVLDGAAPAGAGPDVRRTGLKPLPETRDELEASARGFRDARLLLGPSATERGLREEMIGAYRYLSFATHGLLREDLQGLSDPALVLTPGPTSDAVDDGLLTASEIADLNLRAVFVALSACNTANADLTQMAQDLPALASAFAVAGTPATLGTLWPVDSETGKQVVTSIFQRLQAPGVGPAHALAAAQRAFLAAPPARAWLHPRFWAPFVTLGDGGPAAAPAARAGLSLTSVEVLTRQGGEVLALDRSPAGTAARFISDADARGRQGAAVRATGPAGVELWRAETHDGGSAKFLARFGERLLAGGYRLAAHGRYAPTLQAYDAASGAAGDWWSGEDLARVDAFILAGAPTGPATAVIGVGELNLRDPVGAGGGRLHVLEVGPDLTPRRLFTAQAPVGAAISDATITPLGDRMLISYTDRQRRPAARPPETADDYDTPACLWDMATWVELRDAKTGALIASTMLDGVAVVGATRVGDEVVLGGSRRTCGAEGRATVVAVDGRLRVRPLFTDDTLGESEVRALTALPDRRVLAAASKETVVDYRRADAAAAAKSGPYAILPFPHTYAGLLLTLDRDGAVRDRKLLDSGSNIYVTALEASVPGEVLVGGAVGGQAAILRLTAADGRR